MLLQFSTISAPPSPHLSSTLYYSRKIPNGFRLSTPKPSSISCSSISKVNSYGTVDYERKPSLIWNAIYRRISLMENPEMGSSSVLNQWDNEGKKLTKWDLCRVVKELRKFRRYKLALQVYDWMNNRGERYILSSSDTAIQLDLIAKVHGISNAETYFSSLPDPQKDKRVYGSLLNAYVRARMREKAELTIEDMRKNGFAEHPLPYNVMMTLYMNFKEYDKVESMVSEMMEKNVVLDTYSYNIWLSCCGSQGSEEKMEKVFEQMTTDKTINPNWTTFSTMATMYIKLGKTEKAEECLKNVESRITGRDRIPYHYLLSLYGNLGKNEEIYRVWGLYKSSFSGIPNLGYHAIISSLVRVNDIEGAEKIYDEWLLVKTAFDPRVSNLLLNWYVKEGLFGKAEEFFNQLVGMGGRVNSGTWEILAEGNVKEKRIGEALSCFKEAASVEGAHHWRPKPAIVSGFFELCEEEGDVASKEVLARLLREKGCVESYYGLSTKDERSESDGEDSELLNELQGSL